MCNSTSYSISSPSIHYGWCILNAWGIQNSGNVIVIVPSSDRYTGTMYRDLLSWPPIYATNKRRSSKVNLFTVTECVSFILHLLLLLHIECRGLRNYGFTDHERKRLILLFTINENVDFSRKIWRFLLSCRRRRVATYHQGTDVIQDTTLI